MVDGAEDLCCACVEGWWAGKAGRSVACKKRQAVPLRQPFFVRKNWHGVDEAGDEDEEERAGAAMD